MFGADRETDMPHMFPIANELSSAKDYSVAHPPLPSGNLGGVKSKSFHVKLVDYMTARELKKADIARRLNVSPSAVTKWCQGEQFPEAPLLIALARLLSVPADELMGSSAAPVLDVAAPRIGRPPKLEASFDGHAEARDAAEAPAVEAAPSKPQAKASRGRRP